MSDIDLIPVSRLSGMNFFIPSYQRGYRWTEQQVKDLLNDINEFKPKTKKSYYSLQSVVVKEITEEKGKYGLGDGKWYEVIDGQQRLTTIFLILKFLKEQGIELKFKDKNGVEKKWEEYELRYETRHGLEESEENGSWEFLSNIEEKKDDDASKNIDFYHMRKAFDTIDKWWNRKKEEESNDFEREYFAEKILKNTRFIWYRTREEDSIKVFTRMNIGKIPLTNAELIKALFLNRSNFSGGNDEYIRLRQLEIASEWDGIEYTLQNEEFWLFIHDMGYNNPTRIDFIFDLIFENDKLVATEKILENHKRSMEWKEIIGTDEYRTFRYFYEYFQLKDEPDKLKKCWDIVKKYFQTFKEWYDDLTLYHYIGYCIIECVNPKINVETLIKKWDGGLNKKSFENFLKVEILRKINSCPSLDFLYNEDGSNKRDCEPILLFHNIQTVINQNNTQNEKYQYGIYYRFPFNLYKIEKWDVEHINPNTDNSGKLDKDGTPRREWLVNVYLGATEEMKDKIKEYFKEETVDKEKIFDDIREDMGEPAPWTQGEKNKIWNYTLLDRSTNRSYGNSFFSSKRRVIIDKENGKFTPIPKLTEEGIPDFGDESKGTSSFIPPCTKYVFLKYYSPAVGNSNYWLKEDAERYESDIAKCIKQIHGEILKTK